MPGNNLVILVFNVIMIYYFNRNGIERYQRNMNVFERMPDVLIPEGRTPLGSDISEQVLACNLNVPFDWKSIVDKKRVL